jgi:hypothetical protein
VPSLHAFSHVCGLIGDTVNSESRYALTEGVGSDVHEHRYSIESDMSINFLSLSLDGLPLRSASNTEPVSRNFSVSLRTALR